METEKNLLKNSNKFLDLHNLSVVSNIQSKALFDNSSQVIYGPQESHLPEHLNGLGYMNILYLLLTIEIKKTEFKRANKDINLLFIEEPEAHTHPQMQYVFSKEIIFVLKEVESLQTLITSHSSHIVSQSDFEDIRYLKLTNNTNIEIKNFHTELKEKYDSEPKHFQFLKQYLNIQSAELFFASKVIFIEGITERMLLPYFIQNFDNENNTGEDDYVSLASQNISILEVGANANVFAPFLEFLDIKTLVITDIDTTDKNADGKAMPVFTSNCTSNATLKYFYNSPAIQSDKFTGWFRSLREHSLDSTHGNITIAYQKKEAGHHARSFEEAFINLNKNKIVKHKDSIQGLKNKRELEGSNDIYALTNNLIDKKSDFAASLLYLALSENDIVLETPLYIKEGLMWVWANDSA